MKESLRLASVDIGTNSTRLLVADCDGSGTVTIDRRMVITRLGEGVDENHRLLAPAVERTRAALERYGEVVRQIDPAGVAAAATAVLRDCEGCEDFLDLARETIGVKPRVLDGSEEAFMSFLGAVSGLDGKRLAKGEEVLVFDIGGGSTELIVGRITGRKPARRLKREEIKARSVDVGCVRMSERFLTSDPPSPVSIGRMESYIVQRLRPVMELLLPRSPELAVGLAGTVTTVSGINMGLDEYDTDKIHHSKLSRRSVEETFVRLATVPIEERKRVMGLEPGRADVIVGGAAVLRVIMDLAGLEEILVSEKDILDGLIIDLYRHLAS